MNSVEQFKKEYIDDYDPKEGNTPDRVLRIVRYILRTPEAFDIVEHAKKIMVQLNKQKCDFLATKSNKIIRQKLTPKKK